MSRKPSFDMKQLMTKVGAPTAQVMATMCGLSRKDVHNRVLRGVSWTDADELAVRCGFLPWEVWPEWADVDPSTWLPPLCRIHGNDFAEDLDDLTQQCSACCSPESAAWRRTA